MEDTQTKNWWQQMPGTANCELICTVIFMIACTLPWLYTMVNGESLYEFRPIKSMGTEGCIMFYGICLLNIVLLITRRISWVSLIITTMMVATFLMSDFAADELAFTLNFLSGFISTPGTNLHSQQGDIAVINMGYAVLLPIIAISCSLIVGWFKSLFAVFKRKDECATGHFYHVGIGLAIFVILLIFISHKFKGVENIDEFLRRLKHLSYPYLISTVTASIMLIMSFIHLMAAIIVLIIQQIPKSEEPVAAAAPDKATEKNSEWRWVGIALTLVVLLLVGFITFFTHKVPNKEATEATEEVTTEEIPCEWEGENPADLITGYSFKIANEDGESVLFAANQHGEFNTGFSVTDDGNMYINLLYQADFDGDGEMEAFVEDYQGGNCVPDCYIVYYDKKAEEFRRADGFPMMEEINFDTKEKGNKVHIIITQGVSRSRYEFSNHQIKLIDTKLTVDTSNPYASFEVSKIFGKAVPEGSEEKTVRADIDGDGEEESLTFYRDDSAAFDFGYSMQLNMISKSDGSSWIIAVTGSPIVFLRATTNGMPDLLVSDCWLYRWNGDEYLMQ